MVIVWRPGYRIDSRTIKGGSQVSSLIVSFVESSNHCILASSFLILIFLSFEVLELVVISVKALVLRNQISYASSIAFSVLEVLPVLFEEGFSPFSYGPFIISFLLLFLRRLC